MYTPSLSNEGGRLIPFSELLAHLLKAAKLSRKAFALKFGISPSTIKPWALGEHTPSLEHKPHLIAIEKHYSLPPGTLTAYLPKHSLHAADSYTTRQTTIGRRLSTNLRLRYGLKPLPKKVGATFKDLTKFMTGLCPPKGYKRNSTWRVDADGRVPTADIYRGYSSYFFGFLCLPSDSNEPKMLGKGFSAADLSFALLGDSELVEAYIEFKKVRADGHYTNETRNFLRFCRSLLRAKTGYLAQHPELGLSLPEPVAPADWAEWCEESRERLKDLLKPFGGDKPTREGRDVEEPIQKILSMPHPIEALRTMLTNMEADKPSPTASKVTHAVHHRNGLLVRLLSSNPLRIKHYSWMTWRADNKGNLYQKEDGSWWLRFPPRCSRTSAARRQSNTTCRSRNVCGTILRLTCTSTARTSQAQA